MDSGTKAPQMEVAGPSHPVDQMLTDMSIHVHDSARQMLIDAFEKNVGKNSTHDSQLIFLHPGVPQTGSTIRQTRILGTPKSTTIRPLIQKPRLRTTTGQAVSLPQQPPTGVYRSVPTARTAATAFGR